MFPDNVASLPYTPNAIISTSHRTALTGDDTVLRTELHTHKLNYLPLIDTLFKIKHCKYYWIVGAGQAGGQKSNMLIKIGNLQQ